MERNPGISVIFGLCGLKIHTLAIDFQNAVFKNILSGLPY